MECQPADSMTFAGLPHGGSIGPGDWIAVGRSLIAIDTLIHNFFRRTGILKVTKCEHLYGAACYGRKVALRSWEDRRAD